MSILERLRKKDIKNIFKEKNINHIYLIGSYSRGEENKNSDIDIVFEESKNNNFSLFDLIKIKNNLEKKLSKKIDLVSNNSINKHYRTVIENEKQLIF
ncbi:MAG: nucleotidyltransferase domain-containing protein [Candidatus Gracilibacteria bacterium]|nr:nucleotidyltransferase domain-containing protein [Candidatus Gracilibacteria bacterium]